MKAYDVYLKGELIDTVFWINNSDCEEVRKSLINHDGYNSAIIVKCAK